MNLVVFSVGEHGFHYEQIFLDGAEYSIMLGTVKRHQCPFCDYASLLLANVKRHILTHTGERPFICSVCNKGFIEKKNLTTHMLKHTGERPHKCQLCSKSFMRKDALKSHMIVHYRF
ncbi:b lymphocyte-induced maturation protein 1 homolog [Trichonephila clavipes]|nr:b lymphocyte-induced maturation protein 1 homolog [Trichonephila clavipes]